MPTWKGTETSLSYVQCFLYLVSSTVRVSSFHITCLDIFWTDLIYIYTHTYSIIYNIQHCLSHIYLYDIFNIHTYVHYIIYTFIIIHILYNTTIKYIQIYCIIIYLYTTCIYCEVCLESIHHCNMENRDIYWRRYKIQETLYIGQWCLGPLQSRHLGIPHNSANCHQLPPCIFLSLINGLKCLTFQRWF